MKLATLCYVMDKKKNLTLMIHRTKKKDDIHEGKWNGLGGKIEKRESPEDCVIREVKEESGLTISSPRMHGFITFPLFDGVHDWYVFIFTAADFSGTLIDSHEGELKWIPNDKLLDLNLWEGDRVFLEWLFKDEFFSAKFIYEKGVFKKYEVNFY